MTCKKTEGVYFNKNNDVPSLIGAAGWVPLVATLFFETTFDTILLNVSFKMVLVGNNLLEWQHLVARFLKG